MKKLKLSAEDKTKLVEEFTRVLENYGSEEELDLKVKFEKELTAKPDEKINILFTPLAYLKSAALVKEFKGEVGWQGLMKQLDNRSYLVYDIIVYPQSVSGARTLDPTKTNDWYEKYEDVIEDMRFQAHSHVEMSTTPSTTDVANQRNVVRNTISGGYVLFQIWNKKGDINSFFYDIDNNTLYERDDINIEIQCAGEFNTLKAFVEDAKKQVDDLVKPMASYVPKTGSGYSQMVNPKPAAPVAAEYQWKSPNYYSPYEESAGGSPYYAYDEYLPVEKNKIQDPFYWKDSEGNEGW